MSSSASVLIGDDRAQLISQPVLPILGILLLILVIVINEMLSIAAWTETASALIGDTVPATVDYLLDTAWAMMTLGTGEAWLLGVTIPTALLMYAFVAGDPA